MTFPIKLLHLYGQHSWHEEAYIVGNREGLSALRDALNGGFVRGEASCEVMAADGEGYTIVIRLEDTPWEGPYWSEIAMPYTDEPAAEKDGSAKWPWGKALA